MRWITPGEFTEWMAFSELEPFGSDIESWRSATIASLIANANRDAKRHPAPYSVSDFMPEEPMTDRERAERLTSRIGSAMMTLGGRVQPAGTPRRRRKPDSEVSAAVALLRAGGARPVTIAPPPARRRIGPTRPSRPARPTRKE